MKGDGIPLTPASFHSYQCGKTFLTRYEPHLQPPGTRIFTTFYALAAQLHGIFTPCRAILEGMKTSLYRARQLSLALLVVAVVDHGHMHNDYSGAAPSSSGLLRLGRDVLRRCSS